MAVNDAPAETPDGLYDEERLNMQIRDETRQGDTTWGKTRTSHPIDREIRPSIETLITNNRSTTIMQHRSKNRPIPNTTVSEKDKFDHQFLTPDEFGIFRDPNGYTKEIDGRTLHVSREDIADILQTANGADNLFMHHCSNPEQKATKEFYDTAGGLLFCGVLQKASYKNLTIQLKHRSTLPSQHRSTDSQNSAEELMISMVTGNFTGKGKMSMESTEMIGDTPEI
ncbi:hypothetical protein YC2023_010860 [Brassica napus]